MNNPNPITEANMLAYLRDVTEFYAPQFPELCNFSAGAAHGNAAVAFFGDTDNKYNSICGIGLTFEAACADLRAKLGNPKGNAAKLREQAAKLMAEANKLEGAK